MRKNLLLTLFNLLIINTLNSQNLLSNGGFESGGNNIGFNINGSGYNQITAPFTGNTNSGDYAFVTSPQPMNTAFFLPVGDHTTGTGTMLAIDGNTTGGSQRFWRAGANGSGVCGLTVGQTYTFSYWIRSISSNSLDAATLANIGIQMTNANSVTLVAGTAQASPAAAGWQQVRYTFVPTNACVTIELWNANTNAVGNDFAVDDFAVNPPPTPLFATFSSTGLSCPGLNDGTVRIYASGGTQPYANYVLSGPTPQTNTLGIFSGLVNGNYTCLVTDANGSTFSITGIFVPAATNPLSGTFSSSICQGSPITLNVAGGTTYAWTSSPADPTLVGQTTSATPTVTPTVATTYTVSSTNTVTRNLITNGNFTQNRVGFYSDYTYVNPSVPVTGQQGAYGIVTNPSTWFAPFSSCTDHTNGFGRMLVVDGSVNNGGNDRFWCQNVTVTPSTNYTFSYWVQTLATPSPAQIDVVINGVSVGIATAPTTAACGNWTQYTYTWNSGTATTAIICMIDRNTALIGNEFAIDDITFTTQTSCLYQRSFTITPVVQPTATLTGTQTVCPNTTAVLTVTGTPNTIVIITDNINNGFGNVSLGATGTATYPTPPITATSIFSIVTVNTNPAGCSNNNVNSSVTVTVNVNGCATVFTGGVTVGTTVAPICNVGDSRNLASSFIDLGTTTSYAVETIPYCPQAAFENPTWNQLYPNLVTGDDRWSPEFDFPSGMQFCFFGNSYNKLRVGTNGVITFATLPGAANATPFCPYFFNQTIPNAGFPILNAIYGVYQDTDYTVTPTPPAQLTTNYKVEGTFPCRKFIVNFSNLPQFGCNNSVGLQTSQIVLYEVSNIIEVYVQRRVPCNSWQSGVGVIGIQNATGSLGYAPPGRNTGNWTATNEAYRFRPNGPSAVTFQWLEGTTQIGTTPNITVTPTVTTTYTAQATYNNCNVPVVVSTDVTVDVFPDLTNAPQDITQCANPIFNLTTNNAAILGTLNPNNYTISYHATLQDAGNVANPIPNPAMYTTISTTGTQIIYVAIQGPGLCVNVKTFNIINSPCFICSNIDTPSPTQTLCIGGDPNPFSVATGYTGSDAIRYVYFTTQQTGNTMYTGGNSLGLVTPNSGFAVYDAGVLGTAGSLPNVAGTYYVYAIANPTSGDPTCRPFAEIIVIVNQAATAGTNGSVTICDTNIATINLFDLITGESAGGTWTQTSGVGGVFDAANGTFTPAAGSTTSTFEYAVTPNLPCPTSVSTATVTVNPQPNAGTDGSVIICDTDTTVINLFSIITGEQSGGTWVRTGGTGGTFDSANGTFAAATAATNSTFTYTILGIAPCTNSVSTATITINLQTTAGTSGSTTICSGDFTTINLFDIITGEDATGVWTQTSGTGGNFNATNGTFTPDAATTASTFSYTVNPNTPCPASSSTATVTINSQPIAGTDGTIIICDSDTTVVDLFSIITGEQLGGTWVRTGGTGGNFNASNGTFAATTSATSSTFTYTLVGTAPCANSFSTATITINSQTTAGISGNTTICSGDFTTINLFDIITGEDATGVWTQTSGTGGNFNPTNGTFTPDAATTASTFSYTVNPNTPCTSNTSSATISINSQINPGTNGLFTICDTDTATIDLFGIITGEQPGGVWTRTSGTGGNFNALTGTFTPTAGATSSTFQYLLTATAPCTDAFSEAAIVINTQPNAGADGAITVCDNATASIDLFSLITGEQAGGVWTRTGGTGGTFDAATATFIPAPGATSSTFQYLIAAIAPCVDDFSIATIGINPQPNAGTDGLITICETSTALIDLFTIITGEQSNGVWTRTSGTGGIFNATAGTFTPAVGASNSTFTYTISATAPCLADDSLATININAQPIAGSNGTVVICNTETATIDLFGIITGEQSGGVWTRTSGTGGTFDAAAGTFTPTATTTSSTFTYTIAAVAPCTNAQSIATITVNQQLNAGEDGGTTVCESSTEGIDLFGLISGEQLGGIWTQTSGTGGTFDAANATFTPGFGATTSTFRYTLTGVAPCVDDFSEVIINFVTAPAINQPTNFVVCDDSLNNDGIFCFDLTTKDDEVSTDPNVVITYHVTSIDALVGNNPLPNPFCNNEVGTQTIYVRVSDPIATQCPSTTSFQLIVNPLPLPNPVVTDYFLCDDNNAGDGIEVFDLSTKSTEIANGQTNVIITYYDNEQDAIDQNTPLPNNYSNTTPNQQTIWFNIAFNTTNCSTVGSFDLIVNPLPISTQPGYPNYELCDNDTTQIGQEEFDLATRVDAILLGQTGMNVAFYPTLNDAIQNTNEITNLLYTNQVAFQQTLGIRITNTATGCFATSVMDLIVNPLPVLVQPTLPFTFCDTDQNGSTEIDLDAITAQIVGANNYTISYHVTLIDAQNGFNAMPSPFTNNEPFMQTLYVRAVDAAGNGCSNVIAINLVVSPRPIVPNLSPLVNCDQDSNNQNGITAFNLELQTPIILNAQTPPSTNYSVRYYLTQAAAQAQNAPIIPTTNFQGSNNQVIWYTIRNTVTGCFEVGSFTLTVNTPMVLTFPTVYAICDNDNQPNNQFTTFDLPSFVTNFSNPPIPAGYVYEFYNNSTNPATLITNPSAFVNTSPANQTISVRVINTATGCVSTRFLTLRVFRVPTPRLDPPALAPQCDYNNPGDGFEVFDLTVNALYISNNEANVTLHYYPSLADATAIPPTNEILNPTMASVNGNVWIRVENTAIDFNNQNCYTLVEQALVVNPLPIVNQAITDYQICQDNANSTGTAIFDLTTKNVELLGPTQNTADFTITFYTTQPNAQSGTAPIANPSMYTNATNPQTIYVRVVNNATGCVNSTGVFQIVVNPKPTATMPAMPIANCDTDGMNDGFFEVNLTALNTEVLNGQDPVLFTVSYHTSQADADSGSNAIVGANAYLANTQTVYIRVTNNTTGCYQTTTINIITEQIPEPIITTIGGVNVLCVNFTDDSIERPLQLVAQNAIVGNYTYQWFVDGAAIAGATNATFNVPFDPLNMDRDYTVLMTSTSTLACNVLSNVFTVRQSGKAVAIDGGYTVTNAFAENQIITITIDGYGAPDYQFSLDDGPRQTSPIFENVGLGNHTVSVWDVKGEPFACDPLELLNVQTIDYPHYFTPNGDGIHDFWNINGLINQPSAKIYIFDRYGKLVKQISPTGQGWDGTYNGNMLPSTDYWFTVDFSEATGNKQFKAHFSLKR